MIELLGFLGVILCPMIGGAWAFYYSYEYSQRGRND